ncbi:MAG: hypothetical protein KGL46_00345 [Hyphomicrobiales bacterium]|nr:hypothetical protein [Hyphomicrobiales bacterium]
MNSAPFEIQPVRGLSGFAEFSRAQRLIYAGMEGFSPSLDLERWTLYGHALNPHYKLVDSARWLARRGGKTIGRIEAHAYKTFKPVDASPFQFGSLDAIDDPAVVAALLQTAETWLNAKGAETVVGPFSPSINGEMGLLVEGVAATPMIFMPWHPGYLSRHVEAAGYAKAKDVISYRYDITPKDRAADPSIITRGEWKERLKFRPLRFEALASEVDLFTQLFNDAWSGNWGYVPMTREEFKSNADSFKFIMTPDWGFVVELDGEPVSFGVVIPNLHELAAPYQGKLGVAGALKLLPALKKHTYNSGRLALFGLKKTLHRSTKAGVILLAMIEELRLRTRKIALNQVEFGWVLEDNVGMRRPIEMAGGKIDKIHRIYQKRIAGAPAEDARA